MVVVREDGPREGMWGRWMRALRVKSSKEEDWNKQLQVEWARLCMLIEELCVCEEKRLDENRFLEELVAKH